ncbi:MAG: CotH protein, partial [Clostridiales bacterium]|nr:CotH protein [Clostridiales bacterium]
MIENKNINLIILIIMLLAVIFTSILIVIPKNTIATVSNNQPEYVSKIFNQSKVTDINIEMSQTDWNWILENATKEEYRSGNITINGETFYNVGIRPKGNSSLSSVANSDTDRFSFKIDFDAYMDGQTAYGLDKLVLNNMMSDTTYMKEYLSYDLFSKMGVVTPVYSYANITINGNPWGLYLIVESGEESYLQRNFGSDSGKLYKPEDTGSSLKWVNENSSNYSGIKENAVVKITNEDFDRIVTMIKYLNSGTDLDKYIDIDSTLRYFAVNTVLVNLDSYVGNFKHNYYLYEKDGVCTILPWDLNMSFAGFQVGDAQQAVDFSIHTPVSGNLEDYPLIGKLLEVEEYKSLYHKYLDEAIKLYFDSGVFSSSINKLDKLINSYVKNDTTAFYTYEEYEKSLTVLKEFGKLRAASVTAQLAGNTTAGTISLDISALGSMRGGKGGFGRGMNAAPNSQGNPPNIGQGQNGKGANMQEAMKIIDDANGGELTEEQLEKLKELGFDEEMIERFKNVPPGGDRQNPNANAPGNNKGGFPMEQDGFNGGGMGNNRNKSNPINTQYLRISGITIGVCALFLT